MIDLNPLRVLERVAGYGRISNAACELGLSLDSQPRRREAGKAVECTVDAEDHAP